MRYFNNIPLNTKSIIKPIVSGAVSSVLMISALMCIVSAILLFSSIMPYGYIEYIMLIVDAIGAFTGGYISARINKSRGLMLGIINGGIVFVLLLISGFSIASGTVTVITLLKAMVLIISSSLGGIKGVNIKEKVHIK